MENIARIYWSDKTESTNTDAWKAISEGAECTDNLSVLATRCQTAGRGQGDHKWHSKPGENLTFSIILRYDGVKGGFPPFPAAREKAVSDLTASAVVEWLALHGICARIKLPNDIYVGDKKICGILIKHCVRSGMLKFSIVGIGININETVFPEDLPNPTSLAIETASDASDGYHQYEISQELEKFLAIFIKACKEQLA